MKSWERAITLDLMIFLTFSFSEIMTLECSFEMIFLNGLIKKHKQQIFIVK